MKKRIVMFLAAAMAAMGAVAEPVVTDVVAKQRYPWNGLVDITCKVSGINGTTNKLWFDLAVVMPDSGKVRYSSHFWVVQNGTNSNDRAVHANGDYRLLWNAQADLGSVFYSNMVVSVTFDTHQSVQLWEGGPYWATTNIGAENPEDDGYYFWWGDVVGYKRENGAWVASDGSSTNSSFASGRTYLKNIDTLQSEGWITADRVLVPEHDAAHVHWGGGWRMPTDDEFSALINNCAHTWITNNGVSGQLVTGKGAYANRSIFLPAAGGSNAVRNSWGAYWSSEPNPYNSEKAYHIEFYSSSISFGSGGDYRKYGKPVRPIRGGTE